MESRFVVELIPPGSYVMLAFWTSFIFLVTIVCLFEGQFISVLFSGAGYTF